MATQKPNNSILGTLGDLFSNTINIASTTVEATNKLAIGLERTVDIIGSDKSIDLLSHSVNTAIDTAETALDVIDLVNNYIGGIIDEYEQELQLKNEIVSSKTYKAIAKKKAIRDIEESLKSKFSKEEVKAILNELNKL